MLAAGFGALTLPTIDPGRSVAGYLAAAAGVVAVLLGSMVAHELAHSIAARRYGLSVPVTVGLFGGLRHGRALQPGSAAEQELPSPGAQWRVAAAGPLTSLVLGAVGWRELSSCRYSAPACWSPRWPPRRPGSTACWPWPT